MSKALEIREEAGVGEFLAVRAGLRVGVSALAVGLLLAGQAAQAQDQSQTTEIETTGQSPETGISDTSADGGENAIVVTGIRQMLANAQNIKRDSDTVTDAITAEDIGALPDRSVTEALQRVPGIAINRFAGSNDPDHFSVEGSGVTVRGLNFVRSEFNGRTAFAAGVGGQALNFADVPSELIGSVLINKNATAEMIEGGLAGTVNLNTRKPFDRNGFNISFSAEGNYGDFRKEWTPTFSGLISNTWDTAAGRFGLLVSGAFSQIKSRADGIQVSNYQTRDGQYVQQSNTSNRFVCRNPLPAPTDTMTLPPGRALCGDFGTPGADGFADYADYRVAPVGAQFRTQEFNRKRDGIAASAQWESTDERTLITADFIRSHTTNRWGEYVYEAGSDLSEYATYPIGCLQNDEGPNIVDDEGTFNDGFGTPPGRARCPVGGYTDFVYNEDGLFQSGYIVNVGQGWIGNTSDFANKPFVPVGGTPHSIIRRQVEDEVTNTDYSLNLRHNFSDRVRLNLDGQYATSKKDNLDYGIWGSIKVDTELDLTGEYPVAVLHKPQFVNYSWGGAGTRPALDNATDAEYLTNPGYQFWRAAMDHAEESRGDQFAFRGDLEFEFDDDAFIRRAKVGARYQRRDQEVRYTTYNWGNISEVWTGTRPVNFADVPADTITRYEFPDFFRGKVPGPGGAFYYAGDLIDGYEDAGAYVLNLISQANALGAGSRNTWEFLRDRVGAVTGTHYLPSEIQTVKQNDYALYGMVSFGSDDLFGNVRLSGNAGLRYVRTDLTSATSRGPGSRDSLGINDPYDVRCAPQARPPELGGGTIRPGGICTIGEEAYNSLRNFADGSFTYNSVPNSYDYLLPSLNLKFGLTDEIIFRLAGSKVMTRPDNSHIRNYFTASVDSEGNFTGTAGDPTLKPATGWQFDASLEWYFAPVGSLTLNGFYKAIDNFFFQRTDRVVTVSNASGETRDVTVRSPANFDGTGKIKGFEVAYQQTFDFLPSPLDGLGASANYTYIESEGLPNSFLNTGTAVNPSTIPPGNLPLEQLSKHNYNIAGFYEKGPISLRAAYNWRSRFLLTAADVIFPYYSIFNEPTGQLDASVFLNVGGLLGLPGTLRLGVQGVNLLNEVTRTTQAYTGDPAQLAPRSYFMNDRRFSFILRGNF